jgi:transcriptional regulator with XRE-family HTH domain
MVMPPVPTIPTDGDAIRAIREQQYLARSELAASVGRTTTQIAAVENGYVNATAALLRMIASALGVPESRITYTGDLPLADRARTPGARRFALAAQQEKERRRSAAGQAAAS